MNHYFVGYFFFYTAENDTEKRAGETGEVGGDYEGYRKDDNAWGK
jgi:hypothetical protein